MLHSSKDRAIWEAFDFAWLFRFHRIGRAKVPPIPPPTVEFLGSDAVAVTLLNEQAQAFGLASFPARPRAPN
jgi:hypothetical protein